MEHAEVCVESSSDLTSYLISMFILCAMSVVDAETRLKPAVLTTRDHSPLGPRPTAEANADVPVPCIRMHLQTHILTSSDYAFTELSVRKKPTESSKRCTNHSHSGSGACRSSEGRRATVSDPI